MGYRELILELPTDYSEDDLLRKIRKEYGINSFSYRIDNKSLDARHKNRIHWLVKVVVSSDEIKEGLANTTAELNIPYKKNKGKVIIAGSGPAGFFAAYVLQKAGFDTIIFERGRDVRGRSRSILNFEKSGIFDPLGNYAFGEGGAGTFSDGKLTSRSKHISLEKNFILNSYIQAGAPGEIAYMAHPHLGSDNLKNIVGNLRKKYEEAGGKILFETLLEDIELRNGSVRSAVSSSGIFEADHFVFAPGHSSYETYRMLIRNGVLFRPKNFALGSRMEHQQQIINLAQWGRESLPGIKAAEYRLTHNPPDKDPVYTFCMCPGGIVVPAAPYKDTNIVNGMSNYKRDLKFANAGCVAAVNPYELFGKDVLPETVLEFMESLERKFYEYSGGYKAPFCTIKDFIRKTEPVSIPVSSYPPGLKPAPLWNLLPIRVADSMREGLINFSRKIVRFDTGIIMGLESKTSAPIQAIREEDGRCIGFSNLYIAGEGSGYAGGIISSGADGIRIALKLIRQASL